MDQHPEPAPATVKARAQRWYRIFTKLLLALFCAEVGAFLVILPWHYSWDQNFLSGTAAGWYSVWINPYFRGAVSGLGFVNLYISFSELMELFRGSKS